MKRPRWYQGGPLQCSSFSTFVAYYLLASFPLLARLEVLHWHCDFDFTDSARYSWSISDFSAADSSWQHWQSLTSFGSWWFCLSCISSAIDFWLRLDCLHRFGRRQHWEHLRYWGLKCRRGPPDCAWEGSCSGVGICEWGCRRFGCSSAALVQLCLLADSHRRFESQVYWVPLLL